jgi:beta-carotene ketolase (CrtO type)
MSQIDAVRVFTQLLEPDAVDPHLLRRLRALRVSRYTITAAHMALSELPRYTETFPNIGPEVDAAALIICPSQAYNDAFQGDISNGRLPRYPVFWTVVHSVADPSLAPAGKYAMTCETYCPWQLADGTPWAVAKETLADYMVEELSHYAPNVKDATIGRYVESPEDLARRAGALCGNIAHIDHQLCQMFGFRPLPELSQYRTPIAGLYLTGSATHPMGAVTGMPGYNAAHEFLEDWRAGRIPRPQAVAV